MAFKNKIIRNAKTGQEIRFLLTGKDTEGKLLEMEATYTEHSEEPVGHYHPFQTEEFTVISGELTVRMGKQIRLLKAGDKFNIPANCVHAMWNNSGNTIIVDWKVWPAMNTEHLLEISTGLANDGKTNSKGMPNILLVALMMNKFSDVFRLSKPPFFLQKTMFTLLTPVAYILNYRISFDHYLD